MSKRLNVVVAFFLAMLAVVVGDGVGARRERRAMLEAQHSINPRPAFDPWGHLLTPAFGASGDPGGPPAGGTQYGQGYLFDRQTAAFRSGLLAADTLTSAGILATTEFVLNGRQTITVNGRFSNGAATAGVRIAYVWNAKVVGGANANILVGITPELQLTASAITDAGGKFMSPVLAFDGSGAAYARVFLSTGPSAGSVDLWGGSE